MGREWQGEVSAGDGVGTSAKPWKYLKHQAPDVRFNWQEF